MQRELSRLHLGAILRPTTAASYCHRTTGTRTKAFTLVEVLVATVILITIVVIGISMLGRTSSVWQRSLQQVQAFQSSRLGFDLITRNLSQCTLNSYLEYMDGQTQGETTPRFASEPGYNGIAARYARRSDLHFVCAYPGMDIAGNVTLPDTDTIKRVPGTAGTGTAVFFQAPLGYTRPVDDGTTVQTDVYGGMDTLLNAVGYYIKFGQDVLPPHIQARAGNAKSRYRLKQLLIPSNQDSIYPVIYNPYTPPSTTTTSQAANYLAYDPTNPARWFAAANLDNPPSSTYPYTNDVADNVIALIVRVQDPSNPTLTGNPPSYVYDSHKNERQSPQPATANQVPPYVLVTMIAIDETSALRLDNNLGTEPDGLKSLLNPAAPAGSARFVDQSKYDSDLAALEAGLQTLRVNYRVFATAVPIRESKWAKPTTTGL